MVKHYTNFKLIHQLGGLYSSDSYPFLFQNCGSSSILVFLINFPTLGDSRMLRKRERVISSVAVALSCSPRVSWCIRTDLIDLEGVLRACSVAERAAVCWFTTTSLGPTMMIILRRCDQHPQQSPAMSFQPSLHHQHDNDIYIMTEEKAHIYVG